MRASIMAMAMNRRQALGYKALRSLLMVAAWLVLGVTNAHAGDTVTKVTLVMTDAQGNVLMTTDVQGNITARYTYRPYGNQQSGPTNKGPGYTGHVNDPDTGLVYMQQRYSDPEVGRFISPDPIAPTPGNVFNFGRYTYANDNPLVNIDPTGMSSDNDSHSSSSCGPDIPAATCKQIRQRQKENSRIMALGGSVFGQGLWTRLWRKWESITPGSLAILGRYQASVGYGYVYKYQLRNMLGQPLTGDGYAVMESISQQVIFNTTGHKIRAITSEKIFQSMRNGVGFDRVTAGFLPRVGAGFKQVYTQRFKIRYPLGVIKLNTVMRHVIEAIDGRLIKATAVIVHP